jgi:hypothetical protein
VPEAKLLYELLIKIGFITPQMIVYMGCQQGKVIFGTHVIEKYEQCGGVGSTGKADYDFIAALKKFVFQTKTLCFFDKIFLSFSMHFLFLLITLFL